MIGRWQEPTQLLSREYNLFETVVMTINNETGYCSNDRREKPKEKPAGGLSLLNPSYLALGKTDRCFNLVIEKK